MTFNSSELSLIESALYLALQTYCTDANVVLNAGHVRLSQRFKMQEQQARELVERIQQEGA